MPVAPVVRGLTHAADHRAGEDDTQKDHRPLPRGRYPCGYGAAEIGPHGWKPCDRLDQSQHRGGFGEAAGLWIIYRAHVSTLPDTLESRKRVNFTKCQSRGTYFHGTPTCYFLGEGGGPT